MPRRFRRLVVAPLALAAVALAAAPDGAANGATDSQIAKAGTIVAGDLGAGWVAGPPDTSGDKVITKLAAKTKGCDDYAATRTSLDTTTDAASPGFQQTSQQLSNHSYVYKREAAAKRAFQHAAAPGVADCFTDLFTKVFGQQLRSDPQNASQVQGYRVKIVDLPDADNAIGDESVGYTGGAQILGTDGSTTNLSLTSILVRVGRVIRTYSYSWDADASQASPSVDTAVNNTVGRTQAALGS